MPSDNRRNIRLLIEYDGTDFAGWQQQPGVDTVQARLQLAIQRVTGETPRLVVAGRTDAGVHAIGQVANFCTQRTIATWQFPHAFNANLPATITVHDAQDVCLDFDARRDSTSKRYRYRIYQGATPAALETRRSWLIRQPLAVDAMRAATKHLIGEHDFESFRSVHCDAAHARRQMLDITIGEEPRAPAGRIIAVDFHANAFCRHMCRILAGTLVEVGLRKRSPESIAAVRDARSRAAAGITAPPCGLTLMAVHYLCPSP